MITNEENMSHGQSQEVMAAMPLHKAMKYETSTQWRSFHEKGPSTPRSFFVKITKEFANISCLLQLVKGFFVKSPVI